MTGPKRFVAPAEGGLREDPRGNLVYQSEYEALVEAFTLYMQNNLDTPRDVFRALELHLGEDAKFVADMLAEADSEDPHDTTGGESA